MLLSMMRLPGLKTSETIRIKDRKNVATTKTCINKKSL